MRLLGRKNREEQMDNSSIQVAKKDMELCKKPEKKQRHQRTKIDCVIIFFRKEADQEPQRSSLLDEDKSAMNIKDR
jgi:hypothetical protein